ncbi:MAG: YncE family protein [Devosia sp.]
MPNIRSHGEVIRVIYEDGDEWLFALPEGGGLADVDSRGDVMWVAQFGRILFYDVAARQAIGSIRRGSSKPRTRMSRDGKRLFAFFVSSGDDGRHFDLLIIDVATGAVLSDCRLDPPLLIHDMRETEDGHLIASRKTEKSDKTAMLCRIDPATGAVEVAEVKKATERHHFHSPSPDGRYWLRTDRRIASMEAREGTLGLRRTRYYTPVVQLWEVWPPRFLRWLPVGWTPEDEMPTASAGGVADGPQGVWPQIVAASEAAPHDPTIDVAWPDALRGWDVDRQQATERLWRGFAFGEMGRDGWWDFDGRGFWTECQQAVRFVTIDGAITAGEYATAAGNSVRQPRHGGVEVLPDHAIKVGYAMGMVTYRGAGKGPGRAVAIPFGSPGWSDEDRFKRDPMLDQRIERTLANRDRLSVPLLEWSDAGVVAALDAMRIKLSSELPLRRSERAIISFAHEGKNLGEKAFFERVAKNHGSTTSAITRLIDGVCAALEPGGAFFGDNQVATLGHAASALGLMDIDALPTLKRYYSVLVDSEHETWFTLEIVPALIQRHGWQPQMINFVWWLLLARPTNGLDDYGKVWSDWGFGAAVTSAYSPIQFADLTGEMCGPTVVDPRSGIAFTYPGVDVLLRQLNGRREPWVDQFAQVMRTAGASL